MWRELAKVLGLAQSLDSNNKRGTRHEPSRAIKLLQQHSVGRREKGAERRGGVDCSRELLLHNAEEQKIPTICGTCKLTHTHSLPNDLFNDQIKIKEQINEVLHHSCVSCSDVRRNTL